MTDIKEQGDRMEEACGVFGIYAKDGDITDVWIWYEQTGSGSYEIYIGYA